jgi:hypothetical protein
MTILSNGNKNMGVSTKKSKLKNHKNMERFEYKYGRHTIHIIYIYIYYHVKAYYYLLTIRMILIENLFILNKFSVDFKILSKN